MMVEHETPTRALELSAAKRALLEKRLRGESRGVSKQPTIPRRAPTAATPLSFAQQRLWFFNQLEPESPLYNMPTILRLEGNLSREALEKSLSAVVARHESLRTCFIPQDGSPLQVINPAAPVPVAFIDLAGRESELDQVLAEECRRPFDLTLDLMLRALLARLGESEHVLLLSMHHIVSDGWSWSVFFRELSTFYEAFSLGRSAELPELPIQYADYAVWQRQWFQGGILEKQLDSWKKRLAGAPDLLELPTDLPRPAAQTFRGQWQSLRLPAPLSLALKALSRREGVTLFMTLLAAFKTLLWRYTQQDDLLVGAPIAGRNVVETESLIGFFINTLVLRTNLSDNPSFRDLLRQVREVTLEAYGNQDLPFEKLVEALQPQRSARHSPLVQVIFVLQSASSQDLKLPGLSVTRMESTTQTAKFDLTMSVDDLEDGLVASMEYNTDLFERATIPRILEHFRNLLGGVVSTPALRLAELPLLSAAERHQLLADWNDTRTPFPEERCVHQLFEEQVEQTPDSVAVVFGDGAVTYRDLNARANRLAHYLRALGVGPEVSVGIYLERSLEMIIAWLAIIKAGGVYVPLDSTYPQARLAYMLSDTRAAVLLTQSALVERWPGPAAKVVCLDHEATRAALLEQPTANLANRNSGRSTIYVIYTSGSTGGPKGVCVPHRAVNRLVMETDYVRLEASDGIAQISNSSFDAATFEVWGALLHGAKLVIVPQEIVLAPVDFSREIARHGITTLFITTALFNQVTRDVPKFFQPLRHVLFGGEAATPRCAMEVLRAGPPERLLHVYGPTETTTFASWHRIEDVSEEANTIPIGRPIANTQIYLLDPYLNPVPIGVTGELYVGGPGLAHGYLNQPALTAAKFVPDPFSTQPGARLYRTGDRARYRVEGNIEFIERIDHQLKIRGFRVEPGEIENVLRQHATVKDCVVVTSQAESGDKRLQAYVVAHRPPPTVTELRGFLLEKLPDYMVPSAFGFLDAMPLTPNGKVNRRALPPLEAARPEMERKYVAPREEIERRVARIWETVLSVQPIGVMDKFFELGGHSLLAVQMVGMMEKEFGRKLRLATVFQCPTVEQLADVLREKTIAVSGSALVEIQAQGAQAPLFLVHGVGSGMFWGYTNLSRHLGTEQPIYAFKSRGLDGQEEFGTIEEIAASYVKDLQAFLPRGPFFLGGYCFGGNVAYEMARQLEQQGRGPQLLTLIDCSAPNSSYDRVTCTPGYVLRFVGNLFSWIANFFQLSSQRRREYISWKARSLRKKIRRWFTPARRASAPLDVETLADLSNYADDQRKLWESHIRALIRYHPKPYAGEVVLFRTRGHPLFCSFDFRNGWGELIQGPLSVQAVPGVHESMLEEPHVQVLARELKTRLEQTQAKQSK